MATEMFDARFRKTAFVVTVVVALVFGMLAPFIATLPEASAAPIGGKYGGNFKIALKAAPGAINPLATPDRETEQVIDLVYDSLARRDPATLELIPWIATSWTVEGLDVTVTIRDDVLWHDGSALTVTDVAFTYSQVGYAPASVASVASNASASTVTFTLSEANGFFLIDGLLLKLVQDGFTATSEPMGCGPYMYDAAASDNSTLVIRAFDDYFDGRVYLDSITYTFYPGPIETAIYDLMNETIDAIGWNLEINDLNKNVSFKGASLTLMAIKNSTFSPNWTIERSYGTEFLYLGYNCEPANDLSNLALRRAITYCIDKTSISALDVSGSAKISDSILSSRDTPWYNTSIQKYNVDMAEANSIMDEAGYFDVNGDGWRERPDGSTFSLRFLVPPDTSTEEISLVTSGAIIRVAVEKMGVNITTVNLPEADRITAVEADDFDIFLGFEDRVGVSPATIEELFYSDNVAAGSNLMNFAGSTTEVNGTVAVNGTTGLGVMSRTNINETGEITAYRNGVFWGESRNQTVLVYDGAINNASVGNTSISTVLGVTIWRAANGEIVVPATDYTLDVASGEFEIDVNASGLQTDDLVNISYDYDTYENMDLKLGTIEIVDNFNATTDTLTMCFDYRGVDDAVDKMKSTLGVANLTMHAKEAQGFLAEQVPLAPIMSYMVVNTFNKITYTGWVSMLGGIYNFWSMKNLQHELYEGTTLRTLVASTTAYPGYIESGAELSVEVTVTDTESNPINDAILLLETTAGTLGATTNNGDGTFSATFTAPTITATTDVTISTMAAKSGYISGFTNTSITVHTVTNIFVIEVTPALNSMKSGNDTLVSVLVTDEDTGLAVSGADVVVTVEPAGAGGWIEAGVGVTDAGGSFEVTLKTENVSVDTTFRIVASVSKISYQPDEGTANVAVTKYGGEAPDRGFLGLPGIGSLVSVAAIGLAAILFAAARKRRK